MVKFKANNKVVFGAHGQIGSFIKTHLSEKHNIYAPQWNSQDPYGFLQNLPLDQPCDFIFSGGLADPKADKSALFLSNYEFVKKIIEKTNIGLPHRYLTFGTIIENFDEACKSQNYFASKRALKDWLENYAKSNGQFLHLQIHTVYSEKIKSYMFLGQMFEALSNQKPFKMSDGNQLREYHHVEDLVEAILCVLKSEWSMLPPVLPLSSGKPLALKDLAQNIFKQLGVEQLLQVGAFKSHQTENFNTQFEKTDPSLYPNHRDPVLNIVNIFKSKLKIEKK